MRLNREKITALCALLVLVLGSVDVVRGFLSPSSGITVPDITLSRSARDVIARKYRTFGEEGEPSRNPFSFSEGWQRMEAASMAAPPLPPAPRLVPAPGPGPEALEAGFLWQDSPPAEVADKEEG